MLAVRSESGDIIMNKIKTARIELITSMIIFGTIGLFVKNIALPSAEIALYRAVLAAILIGLFLLVTRNRIPFAKIKKEIPLLLLSGAAMGFRTDHCYARLSVPVP